jgi:2-oxoglutarate dehydrogenase E1 component
MPPQQQTGTNTTPETIAPSINSWSADYLDSMRRDWEKNPESVTKDWQDFFNGFELGRSIDPMQSDSDSLRNEQANVDSLMYQYRATGHYIADIDPLKKIQKDEEPFSLSNFNLSSTHLDEMFDPGHLAITNPSSLRDIIQKLSDIYCRHIGVEYLHIENRKQRRWLQSKMEPNSNKPAFASNVQKRILRKLIEASTLEHFCSTRYIGKKRFSLEGSESLIPMIQELINCASLQETEVITIGMAHRGRINVLVNILHKTYDQLFTEFEESWTEDYVEGGGDVKFHLGYSADLMTDEGKPLHVTLASNPSHLEFGHSVVLGKARARQRIQHDDRRKLCIPLLIHGDASFPGQGIVAEMFNMAHLDGYNVGGTIHFVVNNQIGFTTNPHDSYSGRYCTDIAKMVGAPIFHVNGDDPEACVHAVQMAVEYRQTYRNDVIVDIWSYRKHGHNESDEPAYTQPEMYNDIRKHKPVTELYAEQLIKQKIITESQRQEMIHEIRDFLDESQQRVIDHPVYPNIPPFRTKTIWEGLVGDATQRVVDTTVSTQELVKIAKALGTTPESFTPHKKLRKLLAYRGNSITEETSLDWAMGELLAYGSLLIEGSAVRLTGQDVERGTFSHRHAVMFDNQTGAQHIAINSIQKSQALMCIHNSPLTESACLGFEYGYSLGDPQMLVIWEAQFGDFANGAQVIIDQFIASAEVKWKRSSGLVMLLPHGYEGQGPEHSSARLERFLALCANNNITVMNPTTPAQIFHALRRQIKWNFRKPLVVMTPKSLLRHPLAVSTVSSLTNGGFSTIIDDDVATSSSVQRVIFCSGKVFYNLFEYRETIPESQRQAIALVRIEELYPFPTAQVRRILEKYTNAEYMYVQEEPENMGAWRYIDATFRDTLDISLTRVCRRACASPAVASNKMHNIEQHRILIEALGLPSENS